VPITQVVAAGRLSRQGVLVKSETALERFAAIDTIVFDKTGTLTTLEPRLVGLPEDESALALASSIAASSKHPLAQSIRLRRARCAAAKGVEDTPGMGLAWTKRETAKSASARPAGAAYRRTMRLSATAKSWRAGDRSLAHPPRPHTGTLCLRPNAAPADPAGHRHAQTRGFQIAIMSGDRARFVEPLAEQLGIDAGKAT
jgi:Cu2+-exporting ATPase